MRVLLRTVLSLPLLSLFAGCATALPDAPPTGQRTDMGFSPPGAKFAVRTTEHTGATNTRTFTALAESTYGGRLVCRSSDGADTFLYDKESRSWIATLRGGQKRFVAVPHGGEGSPVLWVGKWWAARYRYEDRVRGRSFRVSSSPGLNEAVYTTYRYAPELKLVVKRISERRNDHYLGYGKFVSELVEYSTK